MSRKSKMTTLPFQAARGSGKPRDFWHGVQSTGDAMQDQQLGSQLAYIALQSIKADDFAPLLGWIVLGMIEKKCPEHIVIGFFQIVADVCLGYHKIPAEDMQLRNPMQP